MHIFKPIYKAVKFLMIFFMLFLISCDKSSEDSAEPECAILFPNEGGVFLKGCSYTISWVDSKSSSVRIKLYKSGMNASDITNSAENTGEFTWTFPNDLEEGNDYTIKVSSNNDDFLFAESEFPFAVINTPSEFSQFTDIKDGQIYETVKIGTQWWMTQNYNYAGSDSYCYNNDPNICGEYGRLYTMYVAKELAPTGWHLPTDSDWKSLETYLGLPMDDLNIEGYRGSNIGLLLKEGGGLGFDAKYAGNCIPRYGRYESLNQQTYFWTSTYDSRGAIYWARELSSDEDGIRRVKISANYYALSVRYVKDDLIEK